MNFTNNYIWVSNRVAMLTSQIIEKLISKYGNTLSTFGTFNAKTIAELNKHMAVNFPGKEDLVTEWVLSSIARGSGRFEDINRFFDAAFAFFRDYKTPKFKKIVQEHSEDEGKQFNPKNLLDFTLHDMETIIDLFTAPVVDERVNQLEGKLPEGAKLFYSEGQYQIVEVTSSEAACDLARGTKWCTSDEGIADSYLSQGPLYIIYINGKKTAQMHLGGDNEELQITDLRDRPIELDEPIGLVLIKSGLFEEAIKKANSYWSLGKLIGDGSPTEMKSIVSKYPDAALVYARNTNQRFPEGEKAIATSAQASYQYASSMEGRFPLGEEAISKAPGILYDYYKLLRAFGSGEEELFLEDNPSAKTWVAYHLYHDRELKG